MEPILTWDKLKTMLIIAIVLQIIIMIISPLLTYKPVFDWWNKYKGPNTKSCFNISSLAYWNSYPIVYKIRNQFMSTTQEFKDDSWPYVLNTFIKGGAIGIVPGGQVTPDHICTSLVPTNKNPQQVYSGVSTWPKTVDGWKEVFIKWGNIDLGGVKTAGSKEYKFNPQSWVNPDNFLWNIYQIPCDSPLVKGFVTNWTTDEIGFPLNPVLMQPLLGIGVNDLLYGGWYGFLQSGGNFNNGGYAGIFRIIFSSSRPTIVSRAGSFGCNWGDILSSGLGMGMGMAGLIPASTTNLPFMVGAGLLGSGLGGLFGAKSSGCI